MNEHIKKMIAPIVIAIIFFSYLGIYTVLLIKAAIYQPLTILLAIPLVFLGAGLLYVLVSRIREIRSGEEDDLDKY